MLEFWGLGGGLPFPSALVSLGVLKILNKILKKAEEKISSNIMLADVQHEYIFYRKYVLNTIT